MGRKLNVSVFGLGYVGVVSACSLAKLGHTVTGVDVVDAKIEMINRGESPIVEPGVPDLCRVGVETGRLKATRNPEEALKDADVVVVCVGSPPRHDGSVDLDAVRFVTGEIVECLARSGRCPVIIFRSTVPPGTMAGVYKAFRELSHPPIVLYHPEFLREGSALADFFDSPLVVAAGLGGEDAAAVRSIFLGLYTGIDFSFHFVSVTSAEMIKYVNNSFHALKVTFANEVGRLCAALEIDSREVHSVFVADSKLNISPAYLRPGFAYGGSCLPKDLEALCSMGRAFAVRVPVLGSIHASNQEHIECAFREIRLSGLRRVAFLGLSFKPGTDDLRESPYVSLVERCIGRGLDVAIYDRSLDIDMLFGKNREFFSHHMSHLEKRFKHSVAEAVDGAELAVLAHGLEDYVQALRQRPGLRVLDLSGEFNDIDREAPVRSIVSVGTCTGH